MRLYVAATAVCYVVLSSQAFAASDKQIRDCTMAQRYADRVTACTEILQDNALNKGMRSMTLAARGAALHYMGDADSAISDLTQAIALNPRNHFAYDTRAFAWREKGNLDRAIADFDNAIEYNRLSADNSGLAVSYSHRGLTWQMKGDKNRALANYNEAIRLDPSSADFYHRRARFYIENDRLDLAVKDLDATIQRDAEHADAFYLRGSIRYERYTNAGASEWVQQNDLDGALADLTEVIRLLPGNASRAFFMRALARNVNGDKDGMVDDLIESYKIDPNDKQVVAILEQVKPDYKVIAEPLNKLMTWDPAVGRRSN